VLTVILNIVYVGRPVAGTLHFGTPETYRCVQLRLYTCECNYTWRDALAEFTSVCNVVRWFRFISRTRSG
jgi:hypothetical protein